MVSKKVMIVNPSGLHLRPAGRLSQEAVKFKSSIIIDHKGRKIVAKSVLNVMAAGVNRGEEVEVSCEGPDEAEALEAIVKVIEDGLGESMMKRHN